MNEDDKPTKDTTDDDKHDQDDGKHKPDEGPIHFTVNGVELVSNHDKVVALDILKMAKGKGAFEGKPEDYYLEDASSDEKYYLEDWVELKKNKKLLAIPQGPTPVAYT